MNRDRYQKKGEGRDSNRENEKNTGESRSSIEESLREDILSIPPKAVIQGMETVSELPQIWIVLRCKSGDPWSCQEVQ